MFDQLSTVIRESNYVLSSAIKAEQDLDDPSKVEEVLTLLKNMEREDWKEYRRSIRFERRHKEDALAHALVQTTQRVKAAVKKCKELIEEKKYEEAKPYLKEIQSFELKVIEQKRKRESIPFITEVDGDLTLLHFKDWVLMVMPSYLLGKHSTVSTVAGSKFKDIKYSERLYRVLLEHVKANMRKIRRNVDSGKVIRIPNIDSGYVVGTDSLAELKEVLDESGAKVPFQTTALPLNKPLRGKARDAVGGVHTGEVSLVLTREKPETFQNIFKSRKNPPATKLINIIMGHLNLQFYPGGEDGFNKTSEEVAQLWGKSLKEFDKRILVVFTIFSGGYAPAANPPMSTEVDSFVGETGEAFWRKHCLLQKP